MANANRIILNVGGTRYEAHKHTLKKIPATRLSKLSEQLSNFDPILNEYFFDRHPGIFPQILNYYRTGKLHYPNNVCGPLFEEELEYWGLDANQVEPCCWMTYTKHRTTQETLDTLDRIELTSVSTPSDLRRKFGWESTDINRNESLPFHKRARMKLWQLFDEPHSSFFAKIVNAISLFFIALSVITFFGESLPMFQANVTNSMDASTFYMVATSPVEGITINDSAGGTIHQTAPSGRHDQVVSKHNQNLNCTLPMLLGFGDFTCSIPACKDKLLATFKLLDLLSNIYLVTELLIRLILCPSTYIFLKSTVNIIDALASFWFFLTLFVKEHFAYEHYLLNLISNVRVLRIFQVLTHHTGLRVIVASLRASAPVLYLFLFTFTIGIMFGATIIYYVERNSPVQRTDMYGNQVLESRNIFDWWWYSVVTATTVGYGDIYPTTVIGKLIGAYCAVLGVLATDMPMAIIVQTFTDFYKHQSIRSKLGRKRNNRVIQTASSELI